MFSRSPSLVPRIRKGRPWNSWRASASWLRRNSSWPRPLHRSLHWTLHSLPGAGAEDPRHGRLALSWGDAINASGAAMNDAGGSAPRFGVLGPLRVWRGESVVDLGPLQQRVVLAVLLLQAQADRAAADDQRCVGRGAAGARREPGAAARVGAAAGAWARQARHGAVLPAGMDRCRVLADAAGRRTGPRGLRG